MASTVLVRDALWRVGDLLQDLTPQFHRNPERELIRWFNDAQNIIAALLPPSSSRIDALKLRPGNLQTINIIAADDCKPGDGSTPAGPVFGLSVLNVFCNMGPNGLTPGAAIRIVDRRQMDAQTRDWHSQTGTVVRGVLSDPQTPKYFLVSPGIPNGASVWVRVSYLARPTQIPAGGAPGAEIYKLDGASAVTLSLDDEFLDDIVNYVVARASMKDSESAEAGRAAIFAELFVQSMNAKVGALTGSNPNLTRLPMSTGALGTAK